MFELMWWELLRECRETEEFMAAKVYESAVSNFRSSKRNILHEKVHDYQKFSHPHAGQGFLISEVFILQMSNAKQKTEEANEAAQQAHNASSILKSKFEDIVEKLSATNKNLSDFISGDKATPDEIHTVVNQVSVYFNSITLFIGTCIQ